MVLDITGQVFGDSKQRAAMKPKAKSKSRTKRKKEQAGNAVSVPVPSSGESSITVRKIENGYVVRESTYNEKTGNFTAKETFSVDPPKVTLAGVKK